MTGSTPSNFLASVLGQGALGIECRPCDDRVNQPASRLGATPSLPPLPWRRRAFCASWKGVSRCRLA